MTSIQAAPSSCRLMWAGIFLFSLYVSDIPSPSCHIELAQFAYNTALIATFKQPALLVKYLADLGIWLRDWRIAINVGKSAAVLFTTRCILSPHPLRFLEKRFNGQEKSNIWGSLWIGDLPALFTQTKLEEKHSRDFRYSVCFWISTADYPSRMDWCCIDSSYISWWTMHAQFGYVLPTASWGGSKLFNPKLKLQDALIEYVPNFQYLGVILNQRMNWSRQSFMALKPLLRLSLSLKSKLQLYKSYIRPVMIYCSSVGFHL